VCCTHKTQDFDLGKVQLFFVSLRPWDLFRGPKVEEKVQKRPREFYKVSSFGQESVTLMNEGFCRKSTSLDVNTHEPLLREFYKVSSFGQESVTE